MTRSTGEKPGRRSLQTRLREAERHLRELHDQALTLLHELGRFAMVVTAEGALYDATLWREFTGQSLEAAQGQGWLEAIHPDDRTSVRRAISPSVVDTRPREAWCRIRRHDGVERVCALSVVPLHPGTDGPLELLLECNDRTDRVDPMPSRPRVRRPAENTRALASQLAAALEAMPGGQLSHEASTEVKLIALLRERTQLTHEHDQARIKALALSAANERMDAFLADATHDLRSPIAGSKGYVQLALRQIADLVPQYSEPGESNRLDAACHSLERAIQSLNRLARLADRLLDVGRIKSRKLQLAPAHTDLVAIVREVVEDLQQAAPERAIHLAIPAEQVIAVFADADRIGQVVSNFLTNAQRYSPSDKPITVTVERAHGRARVSVRDEGRGIAAAHQKAIWRRFEQARDHEQREPEHPDQDQDITQESGLGLGLYIAKAIVAGHHGRIGVVSRAGHGAMFWFTLPVAAP